MGECQRLSQSIYWFHAYEGFFFTEHGYFLNNPLNFKTKGRVSSCANTHLQQQFRGLHTYHKSILDIHYCRHQTQLRCRASTTLKKLCMNFRIKLYGVESLEEPLKLFIRQWSWATFRFKSLTTYNYFLIQLEIALFLTKYN